MRSVLVGSGVLVHLLVAVGVVVLVVLFFQKHMRGQHTIRQHTSVMYISNSSHSGKVISDSSASPASKKQVEGSKHGSTYDSHMKLVTKGQRTEDFLQDSLSTPDFTVLSVKPSSLGSEPVLVYGFTNPNGYNLETGCDPEALLWRSSDNAPIYAIHYDSRYGWVMSNGRQYYGYVAGSSLPDDTYYVRVLCSGNKLYSSSFRVVSGLYAGAGSVTSPLHTTIVIFDDRPENKPLNGIYDGINWGTNVWDVNKAVATDAINSITFHSDNATDGTFSFTSAQVLVSLQVYNTGSSRSLLTLSCDGNQTVSTGILLGSASTITTGWTVPCKTVTVTSSNGTDTHITSIIYANVSSQQPDSTETANVNQFGNTMQGSLLDSGDKGYMNGSKFTTGANAGTIYSMSVFVGNVDAWPNNQYQLAIYSDAGGVPGKLVAHTASGVLKPLSWNTLPIQATLEVNTPYWLMYNTNANASDLNNMYYSNGSGTGAWAKQAFGFWPEQFPTAAVDALHFSLYATFK